MKSTKKDVGLVGFKTASNGVSKLESNDIYAKTVAYYSALIMTLSGIKM